MVNISEELRREMKVKLLESVLDAEMVRGDLLSSGEKIISFPSRPVFFRFNFNNKEYLYPDIQLEVMDSNDGSSKVVWKIEGIKIEIKSSLPELVRYDILPYVEDTGMGLKDIVGFYTSWLSKLKLVKKLDYVQKTIRFQAIPNDVGKFYIVFKMSVFERTKKDEVYEIMKYTLKFENIKRDITLPIPISLDERIKVYKKITDEIDSFIQEVSEEVIKILQENEG